MQTAAVRVHFDAAEYRGLARLAEKDLRPVPLEVQFIVRRALEDAGLLTTLPCPAPVLAPASSEAPR